MPTAAEPIETTATEEPYAPSAVPRGGPDRSDVLTQARLLAAEAAGVAANVEMNVHRLRPEFIDAWRRLYGAFIGRHIALERLPFTPGAADAEIRQWQERVRVMRQSIACELGAPAPAQPGAVPTAQAAPAPAEKKGWPTWAILLGLGGGGILLWKIGQWIFTPSYTSTSQVVADVAQTADAVNDVRRNNR